MVPFQGGSDQLTHRGIVQLLRGHRRSVHGIQSVRVRASRYEFRAGGLCDGIPIHDIPGVNHVLRYDELWLW